MNQIFQCFEHKTHFVMSVCKLCLKMICNLCDGHSGHEKMDFDIFVNAASYKLSYLKPLFNI